jgi:5-methyltetrahydropteroyltriglutamate--homocysteine methyltransferase
MKMSIRFEKTEKRETSPFRYDIVGSFLRPQRLKEARKEFEENKIDAAVLKRIEDEEITILVQKQKEAGLLAVTDGEFRRSWWHLDFMWGLEGVKKALIGEGYRFNGLETRAETAQLTGKIGGQGHPFVEHFRFLKRLAGETVLARQAIPAPAQFLAELQRAENKKITESIYPDVSDLVQDIASAYRQVIADLYAAGCRSLQLDDCTWGMFCDEKYWEKRQDGQSDARQLAELYLKVNNLAISERPADLTITTHVCRGNYHSTWAAAGGYEPIAEILFGGEQVDAFYLEFDTDRAGDFSPLRFVKDKLVVLGIVSSKEGQLEEKAAMLDRIEEASRYVDINRLCVSPQCGFASTEEGNILSEEQQWDKIRLVKEIAASVWDKE